MEVRKIPDDLQVVIDNIKSEGLPVMGEAHKIARAIVDYWIDVYKVKTEAESLRLKKQFAEAKLRISNVQSTK